MTEETKTQTLLTARQIWASRKVHWVTSYKALLKYISKDYAEIFNPIMTGTRSGKRYYVTEENLDRFVKMFEAGILSLSKDDIIKYVSLLNAKKLDISRESLKKFTEHLTKTNE